MAGQIVPEASIPVPLLGRNLNASGIVADPEIASVLQAAIAAFTTAIKNNKRHLFDQL